MSRFILNLSMLGPKPTGLGVYSRHCAEAIVDTFKVSAIQNADIQFPVETLIQSPSSVSIGQGKIAAIRRMLWMRSLNLLPSDLVYSPTHHGIPNHSNQILTIHDMICLRFPAQHKPQYLFFKYVLPRLLRQCRAVFTVSETTRQDIRETYQFPEDRIFVVPNGVDSAEFSPGEKEVDDPFLLMVGARYPHKNVEELLFNAELWFSKYKLLVTSCDGNYRSYLEKVVQEKGLVSRVQFLDYLSYPELKTLYQTCSALVYASRWEGFGIPPLEALASGSPVIASSIPVHQEVLGDAAFFINLDDRNSWKRAFEQLTDPKIVTNKLDASKQVLARFTWDNSAKILRNALLQVEPSLSSHMEAAA